MITKNVMYSLIKKILFQFDPEQVHQLTSALMPHIPPFFLKANRLKNEEEKNLGQTLWQKKFSSPVGLAAGFDKSGKLFSSLHRFGFSFVESGTFTYLPQEGNPKPRIFRMPQQQALFNRMGFNNPGIAQGINNLINNLNSTNFNNFANLSVSIGKAKNTDAKDAIDDYLKQLEALKNSALADKLVYVAVNISSPNTPGLRDLQKKEYLKSLITEITAASSWPVAVKFAPDFPNIKNLQESVELSLKANAKGIIVTNTSTQHSLLEESAKTKQITSLGGGVSGAPIRQLSLTALEATMQVVQQEVPVIASGGIMTPEDVWQRLQAGASLVQVYSGFIYQGPFFLSAIHKYLLQKMQQQGFSSLREIRR